MVALSYEECSKIFGNGHPLLEGWEEDVTMMSCIEGNMGQLWVNEKDNIHTLLGVVGDFGFLLGEDREEDEELIDFLTKHCREKIMITQIEKWQKLIKGLEQKEVGNFEVFSRYAMKGTENSFEVEALKGNMELLAEGFTLHRIDKQLFDLALSQDWSRDYCANFVSYEQFKTHGIGYVVCYQGDMVAGASTYSYCEGKIEIEIVTKEEFRRRRFGLICGSAVIVEALERGLYPRWDAANLASVALAEKLGYTFDQEYKVFCIG